MAVLKRQGARRVAGGCALGTAYRLAAGGRLRGLLAGDYATAAEWLQGAVQLTPNVPEARVSAGVAANNNLNRGNLGQNFQKEMI